MPLTLRDLTPILTPYSKPVGIDLSGYASNIIANRQLDEARITADQTNATQQARITEDARQADLLEKRARDEAQAKAERQRWEDQQKAIANAHLGIDPSLEWQVAGAILSSGLSLAPEGKMQGEVAAPPSPQLQAPSAELGQQPVQRQPRLDLSGSEDAQLGVPMLDMGKLGLGAGELQAPTAAPAALGTAQIEDTGHDGIYNEQGQRVGRFDPKQGRERAQMFVDRYFAQLEDPKNANPIDVANARQAHATVSDRLRANGYDAEEALSFVLKEQYTPRMTQEHADMRSRYSMEQRAQGLGLSGQRFDAAVYTAGNNRAAQDMERQGVSQAIKARVSMERALTKLQQDPNNTVALSEAIYASAEGMDPGARKTAEDIRMAGGDAGLLSRGVDAINLWVSGLKPETRARMMENMRQSIVLYDSHLANKFKDLVKARDINPWQIGRLGEHRAIKAAFGQLPLYSQWAEYDEAGKELEAMQPPIGSMGAGAGGFTSGTTVQGGAPVSTEDPGDWQDVPVVVE